MSKLHLPWSVTKRYPDHFDHHLHESEDLGAATLVKKEWLFRNRVSRFRVDYAVNEVTVFKMHSCHQPWPDSER